ncbi:MAG: B12-binding domain-containing radical SAM protein [Proteobacteria bacterium]|nr:B12-binding domain-containing radical SAM protein [Pseudomonadota bacterium]MBU4382173.1 B12-binding domain-containing radical SAM protein [Pseudomonadota bacterium]MCG2763049.1 B12-binding domain-containing radical SAM protein [Desulfarculaceae bacterium]
MAPFKVVLINPPDPSNKSWVREGRCQQLDIWGSPFPPLSLGLIARQLKNAGFETLIIDASSERLELDQVIQRTKAFLPELAVVASATPTIRNDLGWFCPALKSAHEKLKTAAIGIHVTALPKEVLNSYPHVDYLVMGEPEATVLELARALAQNNDDLTGVAGLSYRLNGEGFVGPCRDFIKNLDELGFPLWRGIDFDNYLMPIKQKPFSLIGVARGCPYHCRFCASHSYHGRMIRKRSVNSIMAEIDFYLSMGIKNFLFWTENMSGDLNYLHELLDSIIADGLQNKISWVCNSRPDMCDSEIFKKMKYAGCWQIAFGFEFGDDYSLGLVNKGNNYNVRTGVKSAHNAAKAGIAVDGHFIMGYPGQGPDNLQATIDYACKLPLTFAHFYAAVPFPGSDFYDDCVRDGILATSDLNGFSQNKPSLDLPGLPTSVVADYIGRAYRKFYSNPKVIRRILAIPENPREYANLFKASCGFMLNMIKKNG